MMTRDTNFTQDDEKRIRHQIEKRYEDRQGLIIHASIFVLVNLAIWLIWLFTMPEFPFALIVTLGWGSGMLAHFLSYYYKYGKGADRREEAIQREIERYRTAYEKPKNDTRLELTDDGEIEEVYMDEDARVSKQR
jgi:2TM domain-containing protein